MIAVKFLALILHFSIFAVELFVDQFLDFRANHDRRIRFTIGKQFQSGLAERHLSNHLNTISAITYSFGYFRGLESRRNRRCTEYSHKHQKYVLAVHSTEYIIVAIARHLRANDDSIYLWELL